MTSSTRRFAETLIEVLLLSFAAAPCVALAGSVAQLGSSGGPPQSVAPVSGVERAFDNVRLLHPSAEGAPMPYQARHRVFHRTLLRAATAYVAILAVALLILVCARRLSTLSVEEGTVRSLAGAEDEPGGACGGHAAGGGEEESVEENESLQEAIIQQAKENMRRTKEMIRILVALKSGYNYKAVNSATSVFVLVLSDVGLLGGFVDNELRSLRELWLSAMEEAVESAQALETGRFATDTTSSMIKIHRINGELVALMSTIRTADKNGKLVVEGSRWTALQGLVRVQEVVLDMACAYLSVLHPASGASTQARRHALGRLGSLSHTRRRMVLANKSYASYFRRFQLRGFARKRFGEAGAQVARETYLPSSPQDQINYLREHFATDLKVRPQEAAAAVRPQEAAAAVSTHSPPDTAPTSEGEKAPLPSQGLTMQPPASLVQPATTPEPPQAPSAQLQETPVQFVGPPQPSQGPTMQPSGPAVQPAGPPSASGLGPQGPHSFEKLGARPKTHSAAAAVGGKKSSGTSPKQPPSGVPHVAQFLAVTPKGPTGAGHPFASSLDTHMKKPPGKDPGILVQAPQSSATVMHNVGDEVEEEIDPSDDSSLHAGQPIHAPLPPQEQIPFLSTPWAAPGAPVGPLIPGMRPPFSPRAGAFFGVAQGVPRSGLPISRPSLPVGFWEHPRPSGPAPHTVQRPPGPSGMSTGVSYMPPFAWPPQPPGFAGPQGPGGFMRQTWQRQSRPSGPLSSTSEGSPYGRLLGAIQHPVPKAPPPRFPSMPSPSGLISPSPSQPSVGGPPHASPSVPSGPGQFSPFFGAPSTRSPFFPSASKLPLSQLHPPPPSQLSLIGSSPLGQPTLAVSWHPSTDPPPDQEEPKSRISGAFHGTPMGEPTPSSTSVTTAPPPS
ncbi:hypothetical protein Emed_003438 [Eimeria media]